jgi:hypothetical protein
VRSVKRRRDRARQLAGVSGESTCEEGVSIFPSMIPGLVSIVFNTVQIYYDADDGNGQWPCHIH